MVQIILEFFGIFGVDMVAPTTFSEFLVWYTVVLCGVFLVGAICKFFLAVPQWLINNQRWMR